MTSDRRVASVEGQTAHIIRRQDLAAWVSRLLAKSEVIAPVRGHGGDELFATVHQPRDVLWSFSNTALPPKHLLLPQTDPLAQITKRAGHYQVDAAAAPAARVLLNVRPCDAVGLAFLRDMHAQDPRDNSVLRRYDALTVVTLACGTPCEHGFCPCCDAGPFLEDYFDLQLTDLGDTYYVEAATTKGHALVSAAPELFGVPEPAHVGGRTAAERDALAHLGAETCHFGAAMRRISTRRVAEQLWAKMSPWCLECGGCNFACPTCYCFSVSDRTDGNGCVTRCRTWDSCQFSAFTLEASGHNPRRAKTERMKRRFYHKVSAQYYSRDGRVGCVGCGRCVKVCLGATDMPAVVTAVRQREWQAVRPA